MLLIACLHYSPMELLIGLEPITSVYETLVLPLNYRSIANAIARMISTMNASSMSAIKFILRI